ncbi:hypothetical protein [Vannielia litorea]|uniref:hypothetical protein n=1 Tax=Vannielia litorea TaxID=1217970 RepID=UPI001BCE5854|nr:hypothetical protein [Vannielia litorea]MBS8227702.1 hypothetical protein [Vannielia litorea]
MIAGPGIALVLTLLTLPAAAQQDVPFLTTDYRGHTIFLHEDGTWAFSDPSTTLSQVSPFSEGGCLPAADGRISYCGLPEGFAADMSVSTGTLEEYSFTDTASGIGFTLSLDKQYGHAGDLSYYEDIVRNGGEGDFMLAMIQWFTGMEMEGETATVRDGIVVLENGYRFEADEGAGLADFSVDIMTDTQTLSINTNAFSNQSTGPLPDLTETIARLTANITIDGTPLPEWKAR